MVKDLKEGQPEVNVLRIRMPHKSSRVISTDSVWEIRHIRRLAYLNLRDPEST